MPRVGRLGRQLRSRIWRASVEEEVDAELAFHVEMRTRELVARGVEPEAARRQALARFGDIRRVSAVCRTLGRQRDDTLRRTEYMEELRQDLTYALRQLRRSPGFSLVAALTLALGIGANTAIFSLVDAVLLRPLPYEEPDRLVIVNHFYPSLDGLEASVSAPGFRDYRDESGVFASAAAQTGAGLNVTGIGDPQRIEASRVSAQFFTTFGARAALGRTFLAEEDEPGRNRVVVLGHGTWQRLFGGDARVIGRPMTINGEPHEIVGVMPPSFRDFFHRRAELWVPLALTAEQYAGGRTSEWLNVVGRLAPGITPEQAKRRMADFATRLKEAEPQSYPPDWTLAVTPLAERATGGVRKALLMLLGAVGLVLLIACANVANLLLARGASRGKEIAIRTALGAGRGRIVRQLVTESMLLALAGGALGVGLAWTTIRWVTSLEAVEMPVGTDVRIGGPVLLFTLGVALLTGFVFGLAPALQLARTDLNGTLKEGGRSAAADRGGHVARRALVVLETALALTLLVGAGLLIRSFARLQAVDPGFASENLLTFNVALPQAKYTSDTARMAFFEELLPRLAALPGVRSVGATSVLPFSGGGNTRSFMIEGYEPPPDQQDPWGDFRVVTSDYLRTLGAPLLEGRYFTEQDGGPDAPGVAIVDDEMVRRYWPNEDPIGKRLSLGRTAAGERVWRTVVGVVGHTKHESLDADARVQLYIPYRQSGGSGFMTVAMRTAGDPLALAAAARRTVQGIDPDQPIASIATMDQLLAESVGERRFSMTLVGAFAGMALLLASLGIYGMVAFAVSQRTREIGVRMALGARPRDVLSLVTWQGMQPVLLGVVLGVGAAFAATRLLESMLYGVGAADPLTFASVVGVLVLAALLASVLPARRATRIDPTRALQAD